MLRVELRLRALEGGTSRYFWGVNIAAFHQVSICFNFESKPFSEFLRGFLVNSDADLSFFMSRTCLKIMMEFFFFQIAFNFFFYPERFL